MTGTVTNEKSRLMFRLALYQVVKNDGVTRKVIKINKVIRTTKSKVFNVQISIPKQHQMIMSSVAGVNFIKTKVVIFRHHTKGASN